MDHIFEQFTTPTLGEYDLIAVGGGIAGVCAAVSARRNGIERVLLIEKTIQFGGLATTGLISWYEPLCDGQGRKLMYGMADEMMKLAIRYGPDCLPEEWRDDPDTVPSRKRYATHFSPSMFVLAIDQLVQESGVDVLLDTLAVNPVLTGEICEGVIVENKTGRGFYRAAIVVDTTGDADILSRSGVPCEYGVNYLTFVAYQADMKTLQRAIKENDIQYLRKWVTAGSDLWGNGHPVDKPKLTGVTAEEVTQFILEGRQMLLEMIREDDRRTRDLTALPGLAQLRTTRRIVGAYTLTEGDEGYSFPDSIAVAGDFQKRGKRYEIPYRLLYHADYPNLLTAGRSVSASGWAWDVTRVIPVAAATGQAAGTAAALCAQKKIAVGEVRVGDLQDRLIDGGVHIHLDEFHRE